MDLTLLAQSDNVVVTLGALVIVAIAAYLYGRERGYFIGQYKLAKLATDLDLNDTRWHVLSNDGDGTEHGRKPPTLCLRQSGSRVFGSSQDGRVAVEGSTFGRRVCLVFAEGAGLFPTVGSITAEIDPETEDFIGLQSVGRPSQDYLVSPVTLTRVE